MKLYVIGNGFDLAHNLQTSYSNYYSYIKSHANENNKWNDILEYYPENHELWSDAETYICKIDRKRFLEPKQIFGISDLDSLFDKIKKSFELFIIEVEKHVDELSPIFHIDKDALFLTFNYTTVLEDVYGIQKERVLHIHNIVGNAVLKRYYALETDDIVLGHGPDFKHFSYWTDGIIGGDKDYIRFREKTLKNSNSVIKKLHLDVLLMTRQSIIDEVVFYGFSFSPNDEEYVRTIMSCLPLPTTKYTLYYFVKDNEKQDVVINRYFSNMIKCACDPSKFQMVKCNGVKSI